MTFPQASIGTPLQAKQASNATHSQTPTLDSKSNQLQTSSDAGSITRRDAPVRRPWAFFVAGAMGGMNAATLTAPLDVLKTRLQSDFYQKQLAASRADRGIPPIHTLSFARSSALHVRETFQILFAIPKVEGWRALFKGLGPNLVGVVPARAINFWAYGNGKKLYSKHFNNGQDSPLIHLFAAVTAGIVTGTATNPIWVIKTRLQLDRSHAEKAGVPQSRRYNGALDCTVQTVRHEGIRGLYRGLSASYLGVTESTLQWILYEQIKTNLAGREARMAQSAGPPSAMDQTVTLTLKAAGAGISKFVAALVTYPHEVVRTRLRQAPMENGQLKYTGLLQCFRTIWKEEGVASLYGGLVPHMLRVVPSAVIMFGTYEAVLELLGETSGV